MVLSLSVNRMKNEFVSRSPPLFFPNKSPSCNFLVSVSHFAAINSVQKPDKEIMLIRKKTSLFLSLQKKKELGSKSHDRWDNRIIWWWWEFDISPSPLICPFFSTEKRRKEIGSHPSFQEETQGVFFSFPKRKVWKLSDLIWGTGCQFISVRFPRISLSLSLSLSPLSLNVSHIFPSKSQWGMGLVRSEGNRNSRAGNIIGLISDVGRSLYLPGRASIQSSRFLFQYILPRIWLW